MRRLFALLAVCAGACACSGKSGSPTSASAPPPAVPAAPSTFTLSGVVVDQFTGRSIASATLTIDSGPNASRATTADASGAYAFSGLATGNLTMRASASAAS